MVDPLLKLDEELQVARRRREDSLRNYAVYYLQVVPGNVAGTAREMTADHAMMEIAHARDLHIDASVALLQTALRHSQAQVTALDAQVGQMKRTLVALAGAGVVASLATLVIVLVR